MFVTGCDRSWFRTPFLRRRFAVGSGGEIDKLRQAGIQEVTIDTELGSDLPVERQPEAVAGPSSESASVHRVMHVHKPLEVLNQEYRVATEAREKLEQSVHSLFANIGATARIDPDEAQEAAQEIAIVTRTLPGPALFMAMSDLRGGEVVLSHHAMVTCTLSLILGQAHGLDLGSLQQLAVGALLHDVGLLEVPPGLLQALCQGRPMSRADQALYEQHARLGAVRLERQGEFALEIRRIVAEHHATLDGKGFPSETNPQWTTTSCRIVTIADRYDEIVNGFAGRARVLPHEALQQLYRHAREGALDQELTSLFIKRVGVFPVYSQVELNTGERGIIIELNADHLHLPVVMVTHRPDGEVLTSPLRVDLLQQPSTGGIRSISKVLDAGRGCPEVPA